MEIRKVIISNPKKIISGLNFKKFRLDFLNLENCIFFKFKKYVSSDYFKPAEYVSNKVFFQSMNNIQYYSRYSTYSKCLIHKSEKLLISVSNIALAKTDKKMEILKLSRFEFVSNCSTKNIW